MALDYELDYQVEYSEESEYKSLYQWSLREIDPEGKRSPNDVIPWDWTLNFTAVDFEYVWQMAERDRFRYASRESRDMIDHGDGPQGFETRSHIRAQLRSGFRDDDPRWGTRYSMIGTNRSISNFTLFIYPVDEDTMEEQCSVTGSLGFTAEVDFRDEKVDDFLQFNMVVSRERFAELAERTKRGDFDAAVLSLGRVDGFYAHWSPGISTSEVKVLTRWKDHKLEVPEDAKIKPPVLGRTSKSELLLYSRRKMAAPIVKSDDLDNDLPDDTFKTVDPEEYQRNQTDRLIGQITGLNAKVRNAQIALWVIATVAVLSWLT